MWVGAGAAGSKRGGWAGRSCRRPRGRVEAQQRTGLTELDEAEPGRRAGWLGGRVPLGREGGRERDRPGRGKRRGQRRPLCGIGGTWAARGGIPGREQSTQKVVFVPMAEHSGADSISTGQGQSPGGSPPCCPAEATGGAGSTALLLSWGRSVRAAPQPTSPQAAELAVSLATPTRICEGGEGTFCQGSGPPSPTWPRPAP